MSRLYTVASSIADVGTHFRAEVPPEISIPPQHIEGLPGLVVFEREGRRHLRMMDWGFPRQTREMREQGERPTRIGLVADLTNPLWNKLVVDPRYRCLIPLTHFANPAGIEGEKTRTWFSVEAKPIMAWAGFCRIVPEYGPVYAGMTMTANSTVQPFNDRMPVLLDPHEYDGWLRGSIEDVIAFQFREPYAADRLVVRHTSDLWRSGKLPDDMRPQLALL